MDSYNQIKVSVPTEYLEIVSNVMTAMDFIGGLMIEDFSDIEACEWDYIDEELLKKDKSNCNVSGFVASCDDFTPIVESLKLLLPDCAKIEVITVNEDDWANNWKKYYKPVKIGEKVVIKPTWEEYTKKDDEVIVELDPGMAFGTGTHETTRMCIKWLEKYITPSKTVLDVGCGSGILGITALLLGAKNSIGIDIDPIATETAVKNGQTNGLNEPEYVIKRGNLVDELSGTYDVVCANIIADVIIILSPQIKQFITKESVFICSGIINDRLSDVKEKLLSDGFRIIEEEHDSEWVSLVCSIE